MIILNICKDVPQSKDKFVFAYILDMTDEKKRMADQTARALGCCVKYLTAEKVQVDDTIENG